MAIYEKLSAIQAELRVPKDQKNSFGGYNYRSCEDILERAKPICKAHGTVLVLFDELVNIGERYYIKATAQLSDLDGGYIEVSSYAREEAEKKGMDGSQITGASSSYARKYALNGLFCIDDVKDSDFTNQGEKPKSVTAPVNVQPNPQSTTKIESVCFCADCGTVITDKVASYSMSKHHKWLCMNCQNKYANQRS